MSQELSAGLKAKAQIKLGEDPNELSQQKKWGEQLTLDLLPLCFKGDTRDCGCLLQLEDGGVLLLAGLPQVLVGHALLD
jgi:hypothetical protein